MKNVKSLIILFLLFTPYYGLHAATLHLDSSATEYGLGDQFGVDVRLDLGKDEECVNVAEVAIDFDSALLEAVDFSVGESILSLWIDRPATDNFSIINNERRIRFTGGVPGGYCGKVPGDQGVSNSLGKLVFRVVGTDQQAASLPITKITFDRATRILQNDGLGSEAALEFKDLSLVVKPRLVKQATDWERMKATDYSQPEAFSLELLKDPATYDGRYYLMFNTVDKQSGLDHYEVSEQRVITSIYQKIYDGLLSVLPGREQRNANWQVASAPYVLKDQKLNSTIRVKAVDKAGNQLVIERAPETWFKTEEIIVATAIFVLLLLGVAMLVLRLYKKFYQKKK